MQRRSILLSLCAAMAVVTGWAVPDRSAWAVERLTAHVPETWILGVDNSVGELKVKEFYPPDTQDYWQQKIVYESLTSEALPEPLEYSQGLASQQEERCDEFSYRDVFVGFENQYPTAVSVLECGVNTLTGKPIITVLKVIRGNKSLYTISRIWRLEPKSAGADQPPIKDPMQLMPQGEFAAWSATMRNITVCDTELAAHSCDSAE